MSSINSHYHYSGLPHLQKAEENLPQISEMSAQLILDLLANGERFNSSEAIEVMVVAAKEDSVELAEKIGFSEFSLFDYKPATNRYSRPERLPSRPLITALENRSLKVLPLLFKMVKENVSVAKESKMLFEGLKQNFKNGDAEFVSVLASCITSSESLLSSAEYRSCLEECLSFASEKVSEKKYFDMLSGMLSLKDPRSLQKAFKPKNTLSIDGKNSIFEDAIALGKEGVAKLLFITQPTSSNLEASKRELLHTALQNGKLYLSIFLFTSLADPSADEFCLSAEQGEVLEYLRSCCFKDQDHLFFETPDSAVEHDNAAMIGHFSRLVPLDVQESLLQRALISKKEQVVSMLMEASALNFRSALDWAIQKGNREAICSLYNYDSSIIKNSSLLFSAVANRNTAVVDILLGLGAKLSQIDQEGNTCFHLIARDQKYTIEEKGALLKRLSQIDIDQGTKICNWVNSFHLRFCDYLEEKEFESYKDHFLGNGYDYVDGHMDIIGELPLELSSNILNSWLANVLGKFSVVSRAWYGTLSYLFDRVMYPHQHKTITRELQILGKTKLETKVWVHGEYRSRAALSNRLLAVARQPSSVERKCQRLISLVLAGANPLHRDKNKNPFWKLMPEDEFKFIKKEFEEIASSQQDAALIEVVQLWGMR